jgi:truncated hemoglobin YjbI
MAGERARRNRGLKKSLSTSESGLHSSRRKLREVMTETDFTEKQADLILFLVEDAMNSMFSYVDDKLRDCLILQRPKN